MAKKIGNSRFFLSSESVIVDKKPNVKKPSNAKPKKVKKGK